MCRPGTAMLMNLNYQEEERKMNILGRSVTREIKALVKEEIIKYDRSKEACQKSWVTEVAKKEHRKFRAFNTEHTISLIKEQLDNHLRCNHTPCEPIDLPVPVHCDYNSENVSFHGNRGGCDWEQYERSIVSSNVRSLLHKSAKFHGRTVRAMAFAFGDVINQVKDDGC